MRADENRRDGREGDAARLRESDAILRRVKQEIDPQIGAHADRMMTDMRGHFGAADAEAGDRIEVIGTRIGRSLGLAAFVVLAVLLAAQSMQG